MKHYYLSFFIATLMSMACNMASAHDIAVANSDGKTIYYVKNSDGSSVSVTYYGKYSDSYFNEYSGEIVIPETVTYGGKTYSVTTISFSAFDGCWRLTSVTIPNSVTSIGNGAFEDCSGLTSVTIPNSVTSIGYRAFSGCSGLTSVNIPNSVTSIDDGAFKGCSGLTSVTIPNSVTSIKDDAFSGCSGLTSVTIGNSVTSIKDDAFSGCSGLKSITWNAKNYPAFSSYSSSPFYNIKTQITEFIIGDEVTSIPSYMCYNMSNLTSVTIGNSVTSIGEYAFSGCSGLTSVTIPNSVTSIGKEAFYDTRIKSLTIGSGIQTISFEAFGHSSSTNGADNGAKPIKVIWLANTPPSGYKNAGGTINYVPNDSYSGLSNTKIYPFLGSVFEVDGIKYVPVSPSEHTCAVIDYAYNESAENINIVIPETVTYGGKTYSVTSIGNGAFCGRSGLTSVTIPNSVTSIGSYAFNGCSGLKKVIVPNIKNWCSIKFGEPSANPLFYAHHLYSDENTEITKLVIPNDVTSINSYAFYGCSGLTSVTIPNSVTSIGSSAFFGCSGLKKVIVPNFDIKNWCSIKFGDYYANPLFYAHHLYSDENTEITKLVIPNDVTSINSCAFSDCSGLTSVTIPNSVTSISSSAFSGCSGLTSITWNAKNYPAFSSYSSSPFYNIRTQITEFIIGDEITSIPTYMCYGMSNLTSVTIPNSVTSIGTYAFKECSGLEKVIVPNIDIKNWCSITFGSSSDNPLYYAHHLYSDENTEITKLVIPDGVTSIPNYVFSGCSGLTSVNIPNSVTSIGSYAFKGCSGLKSITWNAKNYPDFSNAASSPFYNIQTQITEFIIGDDVTSIPAHMCDGMSNLKSITIPNSVTSIGSSAFSGCSGLTSVTIPNSVTSIGSSAFINCSGLTSVTIPNSVTSIGEYAFYGCSGLTSVTIPSSVTSIESYAFSYCSGLTSVTIPNSVTSIGKEAFQYCSGLTSVTIGNSVTSIGSSAFKGCSGLTSVTWNAKNYPTFSNYSSNPFYDIRTWIKEFIIGDDVTSVPAYMCYGMSKLKSVIIGNSVTCIGDYAFNGCSGLTSITWNAKNYPAFSSYSSSPFYDIRTKITEFLAGDEVISIPAYMCYGMSNLKSITIPNSVTSIGSNAFYGCSGLTSITWNAKNYPDFSNVASSPFYDIRTQITEFVIGDDMTSIPKYMCYGMSNLKSVTIPNSVTSIGSYAFNSCSGLTSVTIPNSVTSIGTSAFSGCSGLTSVTIPSSVTSISEYAFYGCSGLTSVTIPNSVTSIGEYAFYGCSGLTSVTIPNSVTSIGNYAFRGCSGLTSVIIPNSVTSIGEYAFYGCSGLTSVTIPNSVTSIGNYAFSDCSGLTSVTIPNSVTSIGNYAFEGCCGLTYVTIPNSVTSIGNYAFRGCSGLTSVTIPNSVTSIGAEAFYNTRIKSLTIGTGIQTIASNAFSYSSYYGAKPVKVIWLANTQPSGYKNAGGTVNYVPNDSYNGLSGQKIYPFLSSMFEVDGIKYVPVSPSERTCDAIDCVYNESAENTKIGNTVTYKNITMTVKNVGDSICSGNTFIKELDYSYNGGILSKNFSGCSNITSITIGSGVKRMIESAFSDCKNITSVTWNAKNCSYSCSSSNPHSPFYNSKTNIIDFIIGEDVVAIPAYMCYEMSNLKSINISDSVTSIGNYAFSGCRGLTSVTIGNSVTSIGNYAFSGCRGLASVTIGNSVTSISDRAFSGCSGLTSVTISNSVTSIGSYAFYNCSGLQKVIVPDIKNWCSIKFGNLTANPLYYAHHLYSDKNTEITELVIPDDVTNISSSAFSGCSGLTSVTIPNSVTNIGEDAFSGCSGLTSVTIGNSVTSIGSYAFFDCSGLTSVTIPDSVTNIGEDAFSGCSGLTSVTIGNSVTSIGSYAFSDCSSLTSVRFENSKDNTPVTLGSNTVFSDCPLDEMYIGRKLSYTTTSSAGYSPFYRNTTLRSVKFTDKETEISDYEFYGCTNLIDVSMGDGVKSIGAYAFSGCSSLEHFTCGRQLESIGKEAFSDCTSMTKFRTRAAVPPTCGAQALDDINKWECTLYVPTESIDDYQAADQWKNFFFIEKFNLQGDSNGDDVVNAKDYSGVASYIMGDSPEEFDAEASDVDENGTVDVRDNVGIANIITTGSIYGGTSNNAKAAMSKGAAMPATDESDAENVIYVENVSGSKNSQVELSVRMRNASDIRGFQFDLYLPEGVTMANNAKASLSSDRLAAGDAHTLMVNEVSDGAVRFLCSSMNDESFAGGDGEIATLTVNIADNVANGEYDVVVKNAIMTETDISKSYEADDIKSTLTVLDQTGVETVTANDERRDGSIYTVGGQLVGKKATTSQLRKGIYIRNGKKFVVK